MLKNMPKMKDVYCKVDNEVLWSNSVKKMYV